MGVIGNDNHTMELLNAGSDAMSNMYEVHITTPGTNSYTLPLRLRVKTFSFTALNQGTYEVKYKTATLNRPSTSVEGDRTFDIAFRLDANYDVYKALKVWQNTLFNSRTGYTSTQLNSDSVGQIEVRALKGPIVSADTDGNLQGNTQVSTDNNTNRFKWVFHDVWIQRLTEPEFNTDTSDPQEITATFWYSYSENPKDTGSLS
jgi:hypothetical protein